MLLQNNIINMLEHRRRELNSHVRWNNRNGRGRLIRDTAGRIISNIEKSEDKVHAFSHVEYINREAAFEKKGGCIYTDNRLPKWAKNDAKKFFAAADRYDKRKKVIRYYEYQFALPNELSMEQNLELIHNFINKEIPNHYYTFAIHDKIGAMSDGSHNLHVHLMFSPRLIDEAEKEKERTARKYFDSPNRVAKNLAEARKGGAHIDRSLNRRSLFIDVRRSYAEVTNEILEKYGKPDRVDHRSIKAMRDEAIMNGDEFMAALLKRLPEKTLGPLESMKTESAAYRSLKDYREEKRAYQDKLFSTTLLRNEINELELKKESDELRNLAEELLRRSDFEEIGEDDEDDTFLLELKQDFLDAYKQIKIDEKSCLWVDEAVTDGKLSFLDDVDKEKYQEYLSLEEELDHWKEFYADIDPDESAPEYLELLGPVQKKIENLEWKIERIKPAIREIDARLTHPEVKDRRQKYIHRRLQDDKPSRLALEKSLKRLRTAMLTMNQALDSSEDLINNKDSYSIKELYNIMRKRYYAAKKEYENAKEEQKEAAKAYISPARAKKMAENIFVKGDYKKYRDELRAYKKAQEKYEKAPTEEERIRLANWKETLDKTEAGLRARCEVPGAQEKIQEIAMGILRKNAGQAKVYETAKMRTKAAYQKFSEAGKAYNGLKEKMASDKTAGGKQYTVAKAGGGGGGSSMPPIPLQFANMDRPTIITAAINGNAMAKNVVSMRDSNIGKDWKLMSVFEREEEEAKAFKRLL